MINFSNAYSYTIDAYGIKATILNLIRKIIGNKVMLYFCKKLTIRESDKGLLIWPIEDIYFSKGWAILYHEGNFNSFIVARANTINQTKLFKTGRLEL